MASCLAALNRFRIVFLLLLVSNLCDAQPGDPGTDPDVPITGIEILIGAGGALGLKKILEKRRKDSVD